RIMGDSFEKDGETIAFQRVWLANSSMSAPPAPLRVIVTPPPREGRRKRAGSKRRSASKSSRDSKRSAAASSDTPSRAKNAKKTRTQRAVETVVPRSSATAGSPLEAALRAWRSAEAKKRRVPAFRILTDRTLLGIVEGRPTSEAQLLAISGMGMALLEKYGEMLLAIVASR
ncbi:MAG TPA: HRDC domain-containing protein, partial [Vicinamibacterales bacterium]|nr:HRDC domain-containing protein [Vicinamibacterales bacterium]